MKGNVPIKWKLRPGWSDSSCLSPFVLALIQPRGADNFSLNATTDFSNKNATRPSAGVHNIDTVCPASLPFLSEGTINEKVMMGLLLGMIRSLSRKAMLWVNGILKHSAGKAFQIKNPPVDIHTLELTLWS